MGPTASGKSDLAEAVAQELGAVLLNADAFQIYRWMDIGTAKPTDKRGYRLLDLKSPDEAFGLGEWVQLALSELALAWEQNQSVVVVGGTGLYIRALFEGYTGLGGPPPVELRVSLQRRLETEGLSLLAAELLDRAPDVASKLDLKNPQRVLRALEKLEDDRPAIPVVLPPFHRAKFGIERDPDLLREKIEVRTREMLSSGWIEEVQALLDRGYKPSDPGFRAHGYRAIAAFLGGEMEYAAIFERTVLEVRQYAKRQRTWLRREPGLQWLADENRKALVRSVLNGLRVS